MSWFADLAGKAENLLINLDEQTGAALRNQNVLTKPKKHVCIRSEPASNSKKKPIPRNLKTIPSKGPMQQPLWRQKYQSAPSHSKMLPGKVPTKKCSHNNCLPTVVQNAKEDDFTDSYGYKPRRYSLPTDLDQISDPVMAQRYGQMELENSMLKNELNVTNREMKEVLDRLHRTQEGKDVNDITQKHERLLQSQELNNEQKKLETAMADNQKVNIDKETLAKHIVQLENELISKSNAESSKHKHLRELQTEISVLREHNKGFEELIQLYIKQDKEKTAVHTKTENDLRHAHSTINHLETDLDKSKEECKRLEREWESYKHRVKSMLANKDKEIKTLQQGRNLTEDTKLLVEQIEQLKEERKELSDVVSRVHGECGDMKEYMDSLEAKHTNAERIVGALRDALREERATRLRAEANCNNLAKDLKSMQVEMGQTIASLRADLLEKENELNGMRDTTFTSSIKTTDSSALNVADFGVKFADRSEESVKIDYLSKKLMQRQSQIDKLMGDNNILKIQLEKLESKCRTERESSRAHSVVSVQDGGHRPRSVHQTVSLTSKVSRWFGFLIRSHPLFRVFLVMYMVCLHVWVFAVLLTSTPDSKGYYYSNYRPHVINPN